MISEFFNQNTRNMLALAFFDLENKDEATTHTVIAKLPAAIQKMVSTFSTSEELLSKNWQRAIQRFFLHCYDFFSDALKEKVENEYIKISKCKEDADRKWVKKQLYCINKFSLFYKSLESLLKTESKYLIDELSKWAENDENKKKVKSTIVDFISSNTLHELNFNDITVDSLPDIFHFDIIRLKMQSFIWKKKEDQKRGSLELPNSFYHLCKLNTLCLIGHKLTAVPKEIEKLIEIKHLDLSCNNIATIAPFIKKLKKLEVLNISSNPIIHLPNEVLDLPRNCVINVSNTKVSKQIQDTIKTHLRNDLVIVFEQNQNIDKNQLIEHSISVLFGNEKSQKNSFFKSLEKLKNQLNDCDYTLLENWICYLASHERITNNAKAWIGKKLYSLILEAYANEDFKNTLLKEICQNKDNFISLFKLHYLYNTSDVKKWNQHKLKSYILEKIWIVEQIEILLKLKKSQHILFDFLNTAFIYNMYQLDYELAKEINSSFFEEEFTHVPENLKVEINNLIDILSSEESKIRVLIKNKYWNDYLKWKFEDKFSLILSQSESELHTLKIRKQERLLDIANFKTSIGVEKYNEFILDIERDFFLKKQEIECQHLQKIKDFTIAVLQINHCK